MLLPVALLAVSFTQDIAPILRDNCLACHSNALKQGGLVMESFESLMKGGAHGPAVVPGKSAESRMILMLEGKIQPQMPQGGKLKPEQIEAIAKWIDSGAPAGAMAPAAAIPAIKPRAPVKPEVGALAFSPDGKLLAVGSYKEVQLLSSEGGRPIATLPGHSDVVRSLAFSPDGRLLAAAGGAPAQFGEVVVWSVESRQRLASIRGHADSIYAVAFSKDGTRLATASYDKLIKLWEMVARPPGSVVGPLPLKEAATLKDHIDSIYALAFSPDGRRLASGAADRTVKIWDSATGQRLFTLSEPQDAILTLAFHPSGKQIAAAGADKFIRTWDLAEKSGTMTHSVAGHEDSIVKLLYSPDGKQLVSASADRSIRVWDAATLEEQQNLAHQPDWVLALAFSPDGKRLAAGRFDGSLSIYDTSSYREVPGRDRQGAVR